MLIDGSQVHKNITETFDYVVVGSGAGGAVVAKELAQAGLRIAIIEEGNFWKTNTHTDVPFQAISRLYRDRGFTTTIGKPFIALPMGCAVGGTTVINSGTCFRTPKRVFNHWNNHLGLDQLSYEKFIPIFERVENELGIEPCHSNVMSPPNQLFQKFLGQLGFESKPLNRNAPQCEGCGFCCYGCPSGAKQSMEQSYIPKAINFGATLFSNCKIKTILRDQTHIQGVIGFFQDHNNKPTGYSVTLLARHGVILSAGSIHSPYLLKQNRIACKNNNLGKNLTIHPATKIFAKFPFEVNGWQGIPQALYSNLFEDEGIVLEGIFLPPDVMAIGTPFIGKSLIDFMDQYRFMSAFGLLISDSSTGKICSLPFVGPLIFYNLTPEDLKKIKDGILFTAYVFLESGAEKVYTCIRGFHEIKTQEDLKKFEEATIQPEDFDGIAFHPLGSCRMGANPKNGLVAQDHKVFGYEGLYLCDGSVIPSSLGVNPQQTIMAFATRLARLLIEQH